MKSRIYVAVILSVLYNIIAVGQDTVPANLNLNQSLSGYQYHPASNSITLSPGFKYTAQGNDALTATIVQPTPYPNNILGGESNGIVGKIEDGFNVTPIGQVTYEIPISVPQGTGGMTPQLSIVYSNSCKNGLLGSGFDLSGLSLINRAPSNLQSDGYSGHVDFSSNDKFMLDGQRMVRLKTIDASTYEYRTENNNFSKIIASGSDVSNPNTFTVYTKSGLIYEYVANTGQLKSSNASSSQNLFWLLRKVSDTKGNYYTISYDRDDANREYWPIRMDYTGNANTGLQPYCSVRFEYQTSSYPDFAYVYGLKVRKSKLLNRIDVYSGEKRIKYYSVSYQINNSQYQLSSVTETASDGTKINPTKFNWYNSSNFKSEKVDYNQTSQIYKADINVGDFNGDGKADFLVTPKSGAGWEGWRLFLSQGKSFTFAKSGSWSMQGEVQQIVTGDFNGDGYSDFVVKRKYKGGNGTWYNSDLYLATVSSGNVSLAYQRCFVSTQKDYELKTGEFNGDGISDIFLYYKDDKNCEIIRSEWDGTTVKPLNYAAKRACSIKWDRVETVDFNGDGLTDIMNLNGDGCALLESDGYGTMSEKSTSSWPNKEHHLYFGDFNGDGKTDMLLTGWNKDPNAGGWSGWYIQYSTGNGFERKEFSKKFNSKDKVIYVADINGDGQDDFYAVDKSAGSGMSAVHSYLNAGAGNSFSLITGASTYGADTWNYYLGDFNGDGKTDFLCTSNWSKSNWSGCQLFLVPDNLNNLLASITDGLGNTIDIEYKSMSDNSVHERGSTTQYPVTSFDANWVLVSKVSQSDGMGGKFVTSYKYRNALLHKRGRGILGFEYFTTKDETNNIETTTRFEVNTDQYLTALKSVETKVDGKLLNSSEYTNTIKYYSDLYKKIYTLDVTATKESKYEINTNTLISTVETSTQYDTYGNVTQTITNDGSTTVTNSNIYTNDEDKWHLGRLTESTVTKTKGTESITRKSKFEYDPVSGLLNKETIEPDDNKFGFSKTYEHDDYGNIIKSTTTPNDTKYKKRSQSSVYDSKGRYEIESTNSLGFVQKNNVDPDWGVLRNTVDANGIKTEHLYDKFGQAFYTQTPAGYVQQVSRWSSNHPDAPANAVYFTYTESKGNPPVTEFFDALGRSLRKSVPGFDNTKKIYVDVVYNSKGQVQKTSEPYFSGQTVYWNENEYDAVGRTTKQIYPDGSYYTFEYNGLTTISTDPLGQKDTKVLDINGNLVSSIDNKGGSVTYQYNVAGNCTKVTGSRTTIESQYDKAGNRTKLIDPDLGTIEYDYNAYGELILQKDSRSNITFEYDNGGRVLKEIANDGTTTYVYDEEWKGSLSRTTLNKNNVSEAFNYDGLGRLIRSTETVSNKTFVTQTSYNSNNKVDRITYPSGMQVQNEYNANGYLSKVKDVTGKVYWEAKIVNARGQLEHRSGIMKGRTA